MSFQVDQSVDELSELHFEETLRQESTLTRAEMLRRGAFVTAAFAIGGTYAESAIAGRRRKWEAETTPLNKIFGPGGKQAGQGFTLQDGMLLAVTGTGSFYGKVMGQGAKLAGKQIKQSGGPTYAISIGDHQSGVVPVGVAATRRLILQNHITTMQDSFGGVAEAITPLVQQYKVLTMNGGGSSPGQLHKDFVWQTRMLYAADPAPAVLVYLAKKYAGKVKKIALVYTLESAVETMRTTIPALWPKVSSGGSIVASEVFTPGITDFSTVVARLKDSNPDAIVTASFGNDTGYLVKGLRQTGVTVPVIGFDYTDQACTIAGSSYDGYMFGSDFFDISNLGNPLTNQLIPAYKAAYGTLPEFYGANYYEMALVFWELIRRVIKAGGNPASGAQLQTQLKKKPTFYSVYGGGRGKVGTMTFDLKDHSISKPMGIYSVKSCKTTKLADIRKWDGKPATLSQTLRPGWK